MWTVCITLPATASKDGLQNTGKLQGDRYHFTE